MGIITPSQKVDSRVAGTQIGTQWVVRRDWQRYTEGPKLRASAGTRVLSRGWSSLPVPQGKGRRRWDGGLRPAAPGPSLPRTGRDSPTHVLMTQSLGSSPIGRAKVLPATLQPSSPLSLPPPPQKRFMERLRGLFFNIY